MQRFDPDISTNENAKPRKSSEEIFCEVTHVAKKSQHISNFTNCKKLSNNCKDDILEIDQFKETVTDKPISNFRAFQKSSRKIKDDVPEVDQCNSVAKKSKLNSENCGRSPEFNQFNTVAKAKNSESAPLSFSDFVKSKKIGTLSNNFEEDDDGLTCKYQVYDINQKGNKNVYKHFGTNLNYIII